MNDRDELEGLGEYLGAYSGIGAVPTSLGGYGFSSVRQLAELGASAPTGADTSASGPKPSPTALKIGTDRWQQLRAMLVKDVQWGLNQLGYKAGTSGKLDNAVRSAYAKYIGLFTDSKGKAYAPDFIPASGGFDSSHWVWANTYALSDLGSRARVASTKPGTAPKAPSTGSTPASQLPTRTTAAPAPAPAPAGNQFVTSTASVQDILVRLGWRGAGTTSGTISPKLMDGSYGSMTEENWKASAKKRKLDTTIAKAAADGSSVRVNQNTFLQLKATADQLVPPTSNQPVVPPSSGTTTIDEARLNEVLGRLAGAPAGSTQPWDKLSSLYQSAAKQAGLDTTILKDSSSGKVIVNAKTWASFMAQFNKMAPAPTPVAPAQKNAVDQAMAEIQKTATSTLNATELRDFLNIAIGKKVLQHEPFAGGTWSSEYSPLLLRVAGIDTKDPWWTAWTQMLVPGKLVSSDLRTVKLLPKRVAEIRKVISDYSAQKKAETSVRPDFTRVTSSKIIDSVNALNVSSKTFNPSGGAKELADALQTFLTNTKQSVSGDLVWVQDKTKDVFVNADVLTKLAAATQAESARSQATQAYRSKMVADAINASTAAVTIDDLQLAFIETVEAKKAGASAKLFSAVKNNGSFDAPTRDAYTELARAVVIGPAVQQYQKLLQAQLGPNFKAALVTEVQNKVWSEYLNQAVSKTQLKTLPAIAQKITEAAKIRRSRVSQKQLDEQKRQEAIKVVAKAVSQSTFLISVFDVQQGLLEGQARKELQAPGVIVTGVADAALRNAMKGYILGMIFPKDVNIEDRELTTYFNNIGMRVSKTAVTFGWNGANWLGLTQAAANYLSERSGAWMAKNGKPAGYDGLAPIPLSNQTLLVHFAKPTVVKAKAPAAKKVVVDTTKQKQLEAKQKQLEVKKKQLLADAKKLEAETKRLLSEAAKKKAAADAAAKKAAQDSTNKAAADAAAKAAADAKTAADAAAAATARQQAADAVASAVAQQAANAAAATATQKAVDTAAAAQQQAPTAVPTTVPTQQPDMTFDPTVIAPAPAPAPAPLPDTGVPDFTPAPATPDATPTPAPAPAPEPAPAPTEAGIMSPGSFLLLAAVGVGYVFYEDQKKSKSKDKQGQTRYAAKRGGRR